MFPVACIPKSKAPAVFNPLLITSLNAWWSIDSLVAVGDGNPISSWADKKAALAVVSTLTARPTYVANAGDGKPAVNYDGVNDYLGLSAGNTITNATWWGSGSYEIWALVCGRSVGAGTKGLFTSGGITQNRAILAQTNPRVLFDDNGYAFSGSLNLQNDVWHVLRVSQSGSSVSFYLDGSLVNTVTRTPRVPSGTDIIYVGDMTNFWNGYMRHVLTFNAVLSSTDAASLTGLLNTYK